MASAEESTKVEVVKLEAPSGLSYVEATENTITVSWNPVQYASGYMILCKDVLQKAWSDCSSTIVDDGSTTAVIEELYPTATFEIRVVALSNNSNYEESNESDSIFCDTMVGSCTPKEKKCCGIC